ncbi:MAG: redoxin domain-containing protein [Paenibacillus macerans]|uniref:Redoxin domain-containing protein n=1 Tax=Paenibacillus macerans TaxID=44252 RepID=A0A090ZDT1_PAEMA|nr:redoxin domain-containing protein [Paenibacillus macerans]KFN09464.1 thioredoxin family protein [Paenibacillus macerans]MBS5909484.1 redoxin domain-containing protein [Paenibacillus macerans]MCY7561442.1 redoxin domain-containing protein [Paenibacillus macerans]MDU7474856.1 redoxin domain-containing protein [Paenibacillus macerans]MEC0137175.1 redoxin domain-containing protein [Paenibacillus macerans]
MGKARRPIQIVILMLIVILGGYAISNAVFGDDSGKPVVGEKPPAFKLLGLDGNVHTLGDYKGKAVVINFWATWCTYCVKEMPALQTQWEKWKDQDVVILGINTGEDKMTVENFVKQTGAGFPILFDSDNTAVRDYGIVPMPTTFFVDKKGKIASIHQGELNLDTLDDQIAQLVNP